MSDAAATSEHGTGNRHPAVVIRRGPHGRKWVIAIPFVVLAVWFAYVWYVSGVLPYEETYPGGAIKASGFLKRVAWPGEYRRHGQWVYYHDNGQKAAEGRYVYGEPAGDWSYWSAGGEPISRAEALEDGPLAEAGPPQ